jgi:polysaccharide pyruvyl transferase WcaK-like protein
VRIALWGHFGKGNLGNESTLQAMLHHARRHLPSALLTCICTRPEDVEQRHGIPAIPISGRRLTAGPGRGQGPAFARPFRALWRGLGDWRHALATMRQTDVLLMCGTGMLSDAGEGPRGLPYEMLRWSLAARLRGRRLLFVSVGAESIRHPLARVMIRAALRLADDRCYRDVQSRDYLRRLGIAVQDDGVYPDLAFSHPAPVFADPGPPAVPPQVALGIYDYCDRGTGGAEQAEAYRRYLDQLGRFALWLLQAGFVVRVVLGDTLYDEPVSRDLRSWLGAHGLAPGDERVLDEPPTSVEGLLGQLAGVELVVATRFHTVLFALMLGKPVASISYNQKNDALMAEMGMASYCQTIETLDFERLVEQLQELQRNAESHRAAIREKSRQYRAQLDELYARIFTGMAKGERSA